MDSISVRIGQICYQKKLSQAALARRASIERTTLNKCLKGHRTWTTDHLQCISSALGLSFDELINGTDYDPAAQKQDHQRARSQRDELAKQVAEKDCEITTLRVEKAHLSEELEKEKRAKKATRNEGRKQKADARRWRTQARLQSRQIGALKAQLAEAYRLVEHNGQLALQANDAARQAGLHGLVVGSVGVLGVAAIASAFANDATPT